MGELTTAEKTKVHEQSHRIKNECAPSVRAASRKEAHENDGNENIKSRRRQGMIS